MSFFEEIWDVFGDAVVGEDVLNIAKDRDSNH
jgi:hypothetical protein